MKLATLKNPNSRDGKLCVVNRALTHAVDASHIAPNLQCALDNWGDVEDALLHIYHQLNEGMAHNSFPFNSLQTASPLPRAYQWADGSSYVNHVELVRKARGQELPANFWTDPLMYQGGSDGFIGPNDPILVREENYGVDFEAEVAIITNDVPMGITPEEAGKHIKLFMLVNDVSLRNLIPEELAKGFGFFQSKPASSFSPVAVTPDELLPHWDGERVHLPLYSYLNGELFGKPNAGKDMTFSFPELIAHAAKTRNLCSGTIIGSGTVSNEDRSNGSSCIAEKRMLEILKDGKATTSFMLFGDTIRIEMKNEKGENIFGSIDQELKQASLPVVQKTAKEQRETL
ncbi:fumarylacetoacetate hydrolase (plasmid) [Legionella adelaidensis]|uniref:Fumarylacetoacetate hydrolase n=1 Tax=Legionella adelaidensis TaxID=45056 RepID=A0A0W0R538_9GAMM|nr:fumarylacetoacetate hydrolase family protein [Legionella adelaidensis]KTC66151.1 fumarylacetoacetate hydrolase [Legionella adelaidensis]VEH85663.1 fumarylacetoacetate hydrolase [Legionella adelaidensis]